MVQLKAYLLTMRAYGTWLHGDERGSVDLKHNAHGEMRREPDERYERGMKRVMKTESIIFDEVQRLHIEAAIREVAQYRDWQIDALNVRTNHVHIVVGAEAQPEKVMNDFKAYSTRRLRKEGLVGPQQEIWAEHGSTVYLRGLRSWEEAVNYVLNEQEGQKEQ